MTKSHFIMEQKQNPPISHILGNCEKMSNPRNPRKAEYDKF